MGSCTKIRRSATWYPPMSHDLRRMGLLTLSLPTFVVALLLRHHGFALVSDREAVQDISRRSRSAPTDRVQIHLSRPRRASQIGAAAEVCDPLRGRKHGKDDDRRCATRPTANLCDHFVVKTRCNSVVITFVIAIEKTLTALGLLTRLPAL